MAANAQLEFLDLPRDVRGSIFRYLPEEGVGICACACKLFSHEVWGVQYGLNFRDVGLRYLQQSLEAQDMDHLKHRTTSRPLSRPDLEKCTNLRSLQTNVAAGLDWNQIAGLSSLQHLRTDKLPHDACFVNLTNLTSLYVSSLPTPAQLVCLTALKRLSLRGLQKFGFMDALLNLKKLKTLIVDDFSPHDSDLENLCKLESIDTIVTHPIVDRSQLSLEAFSSFAIIASAPRPILFLTPGGETYWSFATLPFKTKPSKSSDLDIWHKAAQKYKCMSLDINAVGLDGKTALHHALSKEQVVQALLALGADANIFMPSTAIPALAYFCRQPDLSDLRSGISPLIYAIATSASRYTVEALWNHTSDVKACRITPLLAHVFDPKLLKSTREVIFHRCGGSPETIFEPFFYISKAVGVTRTNALFEAIREVRGGAVSGLMDIVPSDDDLEAHRDEIGDFLGSYENGTTKLHRLLPCFRSPPPQEVPAPERPTGGRIVERFLKFVKNPWLEDADSAYPLDIWLSDSGNSYYDGFGLTPEKYLQFRLTESPTSIHGPIYSFLAAKRNGIENFLKALVAKARETPTGISDLLYELILDTDPITLRYIISGCIPSFESTGSISSSEIAKMSPFKPEDMERAMERALNDNVTGKKPPSFHFSFNIFAAMGVNGTKANDFLVRLLGAFGSHYDSAEDLKIIVESGCTFTHPDLFPTCLRTCHLETCLFVLQQGAPIGDIAPSRVPMPSFIYELSSYRSLITNMIAAGADANLRNDQNQTLLDALCGSWCNGDSHKHDQLPPAGPLMLKHPIYQNLRFLMTLVEHGAKLTEKDLRLVHFAIAAGAPITDIRTLLEQVELKSNESSIWKDLILNDGYLNVPSIALGIVCDLLAEFCVPFDCADPHRSVVHMNLIPKYLSILSTSAYKSTTPVNVLASWILQFSSANLSQPIKDQLRAFTWTNPETGEDELFVQSQQFADSEQVDLFGPARMARVITALECIPAIPNRILTKSAVLESFTAVLDAKRARTGEARPFTAARKTEIPTPPASPVVFGLPAQQVPSSPQDAFKPPPQLQTVPSAKDSPFSSASTANPFGPFSSPSSDSAQAISNPFASLPPTLSSPPPSPSSAIPDDSKPFHTPLSSSSSSAQQTESSLLFEPFGSAGSEVTESSTPSSWGGISFHNPSNFSSGSSRTTKRKLVVKKK